MAFEIVERESSGVTILDLSGRLVAGESSGAVREKLSELAAAGKNQVVLNMAGVDHIDSSGLGTLVMCHTTLNRAGGGLRLYNLTTRSLQLLVLTKLATIFELFDDQANAVNSFFPGREIKRFDILNFVESQKVKRHG